MTTPIDNSITTGQDLYPDAAFLARPEEPFSEKPLALIREALLFNEEAYRTLRNGASPFGRGALILLIIVAAVAVAQAIGLALGLLTSPRIDILQNSLYEFITQMGLYNRRVAAMPDFAQQFAQVYAAAWQAIRLFGGYPSWSGTLAAASAAVLGSFTNWLVYGLLAHVFARWFRGQARLSQGLGALALSYAPLLFTVVLLVPGAAIAMPLVFMALLVAKFQAVKTTYGLATFSSLAVTLAPFLVVALVLAASIIFGAAYGISQIPYLEPIINGLRLMRMF